MKRTSRQNEMEENGFIRLNREQIYAVFDKGFCHIEISPGNFRRFTKDDLRFNKDEIEELVKNENNRRQKNV